jgi:hypothetical protein
LEELYRKPALAFGSVFTSEEAVEDSRSTQPLARSSIAYEFRPVKVGGVSMAFLLFL